MSSDQPVTVVVSRVVHPGKEAEFARWADEIDRAAAASVGHVSSVRLHDGEGLNHLVYHFDSAAALRAWETSPRRHELIRRGDRISDEQRTTTGDRSTWFTVPGRTDSARWKTFLLTWISVYPTLLIIATVVNAVAPGIPPAVQLAVSSATLTALLTFVILPRVTRRARSWLLGGARLTPTARPQNQAGTGPEGRS